MSEKLTTASESQTSYYAVAVVKKGSPLTIKTLKVGLPGFYKLFTFSNPIVLFLCFVLRFLMPEILGISKLFSWTSAVVGNSCSEGEFKRSIAMPDNCE